MRICVFQIYLFTFYVYLHVVPSGGVAGHGLGALAALHTHSAPDAKREIYTRIITKM